MSHTCDIIYFKYINLGPPARIDYVQPCSCPYIRIGSPREGQSCSDLKSPKTTVRSRPTFAQCALLHSGSLLRSPWVMNPVQKHAPGSKKLHLAALEQALTNSEAREIETQKKAQNTPKQVPTPWKTDNRATPPPYSSKNPCKYYSCPDLPPRQPPPPALPSEFDGDQTWGQVFLNSCQTYVYTPLPGLFPLRQNQNYMGPILHEDQ